MSTLRPRLLGRRLGSARVLRGDVVRPAGCDLPTLLAGRKVIAVDRRGKRILIRLEPAGTLYIHLGMTGRITLEPPYAPLRPHTHLVLAIEDAPASPGEPAEVHFRDPRRFGGIWWLESDIKGDEGLGPEPLSLRPTQLARRLTATRRAIKTALLDQRLLAGLGNIYVDEALFAARIHPQTSANELTARQIGRLSRAIKLTLRRAIRSRGSSLRDYVDADGNAGAFQKLHRVYDRAGQPCRRCRTSIERIVLGGRSTHFCPRCQAARTE